MASSSSSFDVTTSVDLQEVDNAVNQAQKEIAQRFDFKGANVSSVDDLDQVAGRVAMIFALLGAKGHFGIKDSADRLLPELLTPGPVPPQPVLTPPQGGQGASSGRGSKGR